MFILGLNAYHADSAACLVKDGILIAAAEEERFKRSKHWAGFPAESIKYCLEEANIDLGDVDHFAVNQDPQANFWRKVAFTAINRPDLSLILDRLKNKRERTTFHEELARAFPHSKFNGEVHNVEHHLCHLGSAFLVSPFDEALAVSVDGFGDFASAAWGLGKPSQIEVEDEVYFPHSLGIFYQAITQYLGFPHYGDEYKVMGLAPYGNPVFLPEMRKMVVLKDDGTFRLSLEFFRHQKTKIRGGLFTAKLFSQALPDLLGPERSENSPLTQRHKDLARSAQAMYEEAFFHLLNKLYKRYKSSNLTLAGGCAMNSVANGKIQRSTPFKNVYVQSAAGDAGGAIGAAFVVWHRESSLSHRVQNPKFVMNHAYWGPKFNEDHIQSLLSSKRAEITQSNCVVEHILDEQVLCDRAAQAIAKGLVVGWFQGRMEWGPRALGNRSILGDPRRADMKDILNVKIKRRESFRPFAPSILRESVLAWFESDGDVPFMMQVFQIRSDKRDLIPAVTHVDGSGRLQTVHKETNPRYYQLIKSFERDTGIPLILNTSFNENEPVVCKPSEALDCFLRTKMDVLVLENHFISRAN